METLSHKFIEALAAPRGRLYALACARAGTSAGAETALQQAARAVFGEVARDVVTDIPAAMEKYLSPTPANGGAPQADTDISMPADVWARLAAVVQLEAARSTDARALHADSPLLQPDPLLAPKKTKPRAPEAEFDVSSPARLMMFLGAALLVGLVITLYIMTRPAGAPATPPATRSTTAPASSTPASTTATSATAPASATRGVP